MMLMMMMMMMMMMTVTMCVMCVVQAGLLQTGRLVGQRSVV